MPTTYQARWVSKDRAATLRRAGALGRALLLEGFKGFLIVEPAGGGLGDGPVLSAEEADYELQAVWFTGPKSRLREARERLDLESADLVASGL